MAVLQTITSFTISIAEKRQKASENKENYLLTFCDFVV